MGPFVDGWGQKNPLKAVSPVQLDYEFHPKYLFSHWLVMRAGTYNHEYYEDLFRTYTRYSERRKWLKENIGNGGHTRRSSRYSNQMWLVYETPPDVAALCFRNELDAVKFKIWWG
jgi:hypothetical protein